MEIVENLDQPQEHQREIYVSPNKNLVGWYLSRSPSPQQEDHVQIITPTTVHKSKKLKSQCYDTPCILV
jgi:DUF1365 family protein